MAVPEEWRRGIHSTDNIIGGFVGWMDGWMAVVVVDLFGLNRHEGGGHRE